MHNHIKIFMNNRKEQIIEKMVNDTLEDGLSVVSNYLEEYPYDIDMIMIKAFFHIMEGDYDNALKCLTLCQAKNPFDADVYYLLSVLYRSVSDFQNAIDCLYRARNILAHFKQEYMFVNSEICEKDIDETVQSYVDNTPESMNQTLQKEYDYLQFMEKNNHWMFSDLMRSGIDYTGEKMWFNRNDVRYCAYNNSSAALLYSEFPYFHNLTMAKGEILPVALEGNGCDLHLPKESLVPIASDKPATLSIVENGQEEVIISHHVKQHFNYYKMKGDVRIISNEKFYMGPPVTLGHSDKRKKLVLSLFVDGLAQEIINEIGLETLMPHTYDFFEKGMRFENMFTTSDWTYPSLASYITGLEVPDHMMIKPDLTVGIPQNAKTIFEYMKEAGYYTAMISGDWRSSLSDGYTKGIDRYVAQIQYLGMRTEQAVQDAICHIDAFSDTDQYIWLATGDLHEIADGIDMPLSLQTKMSLKERKHEEVGATSIKQKYSETKKNNYIKYATAIDVYLKGLYDYIESHFSDDEIVVTLFADHGQAYFVKPDQHHLSREHANVAFMTRGGNYKGICKEYVSALDYPAIMCELAGATYDPANDSGQLPVTFGGKEGHEFVVTETIHQGDPYMAAIRNHEHTFYFTSENNFDNQGRIQWGGYESSLVNNSGEKIEDKQLEEKYINWIKDHLKYMITY